MQHLPLLRPCKYGAIRWRKIPAPPIFKSLLRPSILGEDLKRFALKRLPELTLQLKPVVEFVSLQDL